MKNQIDDLMQENDITAILISGAREHNPSMGYFVSDAFFTQADVLVVRGAEPVLFHRVMERDSARKTGLKCVCYDELQENFGYKNRRGSDGRADELKAMLTWGNVTHGKVAFCGRLELGENLSAILKLGKMLPEIEICGEEGDAILHKARFTKDAVEIEKIRHMSEIVTTVVARVETFITGQYLQDGKLVDAEGNGVTIGKIKSLIDLWLGELGAENPEGTIFSMGKDAGVPHNSGEADEVLLAGRSIVFDFFPCEMGGGYFSDFTRTWCIGFAPESVVKAYAQVKEIHDKLIAELECGMHFSEAQKLTCKFFKAHGHQTVAENLRVTNGYVHSVGHGLGLNIHERPFSGMTASPDDILQPGTVFTIEPGLYYPDQPDGYGVRIEDTLYIDEKGKLQYLTHYPYQLVICPKQRN